MKKIMYYILIALFALNGAHLMSSSIEFTFWWWVGFINLGAFGGEVVYKLLKYLKH